jgi:hypothetical protein
MALVTISRRFGAGGHTLGEKLCERFGFHLVDELAIDKLALEHKLSPNWLSTIEKEASSTLLSILSSIVSRGPFLQRQDMLSPAFSFTSGGDCPGMMLRDGNVDSVASTLEVFSTIADQYRDRFKGFWVLVHVVDELRRNSG